MLGWSPAPARALIFQAESRLVVGSCHVMAADVATLQNAINRFAVVGDFPRITVDGFWGDRTKQGVFSALAFIGQGKCYRQACPDDETSRAAASIMAQWDESLSAARGLAEFLGQVADDLGLPLVAAPITPIPTPIPAAGTITPIPGTQPGLLERFKLWPFWQQIALGLTLGLGLIFLANRLGEAQPRRTKRAA